MKIIINCSNLRFGGGKTVAVNIIRQLIKVVGNNYLLIVPNDSSYDEFIEEENIHKTIVPNKFTKIYFKVFLNSVYLKNHVKNYKPDLVLSLGNIAIPTSLPQILLIHQPYFAYRDSIVWKRLPIKFLIFIKLMVWQISRNIKYAELILVQTEAMRKRIARHYSLSKKQMGLLPNAVNLAGLSKVNIRSLEEKNNECIKLLFLSKYYPHKNFEILLPLANEIKKRGLKISITITLDETESLDTKVFINQVKNQNLNDVLLNIGNVSFENVPKVYEEHDGFFMPTLLESFSGTYIEAMYYRKPIFTSNMDFATEVCKDAAYYFDPLQVENIINVIVTGFQNTQIMEEKISKGKLYCSEFKNWDQLGDDLISYIDKV